MEEPVAIAKRGGCAAGAFAHAMVIGGGIVMSGEGDMIAEGMGGEI